MAGIGDRLRRIVEWEVSAPWARAGLALVVALAGLALFNHLIGLDLLSAHAAFWRAPPNDMATMLTGTEALARAPWRWPLAVTDRVLAPAQASIVYTDSIPWLSLALKATGGWKRLDLLGLFLLASYVLQPLAMVALLRACGVVRWVPLLLGAGLSLLLPAWLMRHGHVALTGHWLLMLALALSIASARFGLSPARAAAFAGLAALAAGIHAYHLPPIGLCFAAALGAELAQRRPGARRAVALAGLLMIAGLAATALALGYGIGQGVSGGAESLGYYSMNLLGPWWPQGSALFGQVFTGGGFSHTLDPTGGQAFEGYNYLGAGALLLIAAAALLSLRPAGLPLPAAPWLARYGPLVLAMIALTAAAVGPVVYWGEHLLLDGPRPRGPLNALNLFRAHGRFFWSVAYLLIAVSIAQLDRLGRPAMMLGVAVLALGLQVADTGEVRRAVRHTFSQPAASYHPPGLEAAPALRGRPWIFAPSYFCAADVVDRVEISQLALVAVRTGGSSNSAGTARGQGTPCAPPADAFADAKPGDRRLTVVLEQSAGPDFARFAQRGDCRRFLRGLICGAGLDGVAGLDPVQPPVDPGARVLTTARFDQGLERPELAAGWAAPDPKGVWSDGLAASIVVPLPAARRDAPLVVELSALSYAAPPSVQQRIGVSVGGRPLTTWTVEVANWRPYRVRVPAELIGPDGTLRIDFAIPGARAPTAQDPRRIGLGVQRLVVSQ